LASFSSAAAFSRAFCCASWLRFFIASSIAFRVSTTASLPSEGSCFMAASSVALTNASRAFSVSMRRSSASLRPWAKRERSLTSFSRLRAAAMVSSWKVAIRAWRIFARSASSTPATVSGKRYDPLAWRTGFLAAGASPGPSAAKTVRASSENRRRRAGRMRFAFITTEVA
jgi:hypothetical protein